MARASEEAGDKEGAISYFQRFVELGDAHEKRTEAKARLVALEREVKRAAEAKIAKEKADLAQEALNERAAALAEEARDQLAKGNGTGAIASWRQAHAVAPSADYLVAIAKTERGMGELTAAIADYKTAISIPPNGPDSIAARKAIAEMRQELAQQAVAYDPDAWLDGRSRWGLGIKAGPILTRIDGEFDGRSLTSSTSGSSVETSISRAVTRFVTLEAGLLFTEKSYRLEAADAPTTTVLTLELPLRVKFTTLKPASGLVANVYGGISYGIKVFGATTEGQGSSDFNYMVENLMDQQDPFTVYGAGGGIELGFRALGGEFVADLRAELHSSPAFVQTSDSVGQGFFPRDSFVLRALMAYYFRGS